MFALCRPFLESLLARSGSRRMSAIRAAIARGLRGGTSRALRPSSTRSEIPPTFVLTTGSPQAIASSRLTGALSTSVVFRKTVPCANQLGTSDFGTTPVKRTEPDTTSSIACCRVSASDPSPSSGPIMMSSTSGKSRCNSARTSTAM